MVSYDDIPAGVYTVTAQLRETNGALHPLCMSFAMPSDVKLAPPSLSVEWTQMKSEPDSTSL